VCAVAMPMVTSGALCPPQPGPPFSRCRDSEAYGSDAGVVLLAAALWRDDVDGCGPGVRWSGREWEGESAERG